MTVKSISRHIARGIGYLWGVILIVVVLFVFFGLDIWSLQLSKLPFMKIHPRYAGGEIVETIDEGSQKWVIHQPVFDGLIGPREQGFVQVQVVCADPIPPEIEKTIDYDQDGAADFTVYIKNTEHGAPEVVALADHVVGLGQWARISDGWIVRTIIQNK